MNQSIPQPNTQVNPIMTNILDGLIAPLPPSATCDQIDETPAERRALAVIASEYPGRPYGIRRTLVRAIVAMNEREVKTDFEQRVRAAYFGRVVETMPSGLIDPTPMDAAALWLSQRPMHTYRAMVAEMLEHARALGADGLSPEQARLYSVYRKAASELEGERKEVTRG